MGPTPGIPAAQVSVCEGTRFGEAETHVHQVHALVIHFFESRCSIDDTHINIPMPAHTHTRAQELKLLTEKDTADKDKAHSIATKAAKKKKKKGGGGKKKKK